MAKKRNQPSSQANLLRNDGTPALGSYIDTTKTINPVGFYNPDKETYKQIWTNYDLNQCVSRYVWEGLPNGLTSWNLERMLYFRGSLCGFKFAGKFYILPYTPTGRINPYGIPVEVKPITYNGRPVAGKNDFVSETFKLPVDVMGDFNSDYGAVLLYDSIPYSPTTKSPSRFYLNQIIIREMADVFARVNINVVVSNKKILLQIKDPKQAEIARKELEIAFGSDSPFGILTGEMPVETIQNSSDYQADDLFNTIKNYDAIRCFMSGISSKNFGTEKKERLVSGELAGNEEQKDLVLDMGLDLRKEFCELCNKKFGLNMSVRKRAESYEADVNGLGQTQEEVEGGL